MKAKDKRIEETLIDSDGAWIYLNSGYRWDNGHTIHEDTMKQAKAQLKYVETCNCACCQKDAATKEKEEATLCHWCNRKKVFGDFCAECANEDSHEIRA